MELDRIICGDCITELKSLPPGIADMIFADPPYNMSTKGVLKRPEGSEFLGCQDGWDKFDSLADYRKFTETWIAGCRRVLKEDGCIWVIGGMQCIYTIGACLLEQGFWIINDIVWHKKNPTPNFMGTRLCNSHETLIWAVKNKDSRYAFNYKTARELNIDTVPPEDYASGVRKQMGSVWRFPVCAGKGRLKDSEGRKVHSTQKPEALIARAVAISTKPGDLILDPFAGTGTSAAAAKRLGRHYIMIEREESYCRYAQARLDSVEYERSPVSEALFDRVE